MKHTFNKQTVKEYPLHSQMLTQSLTVTLGLTSGHSAAKMSLWKWTTRAIVSCPLGPPLTAQCVYSGRRSPGTLARPCVLWPLATPLTSFPAQSFYSSCSGLFAVSQANQQVSEWGRLYLFSTVPEALLSRCTMEVTVPCYFIIRYLGPSYPQGLHLPLCPLTSISSIHRSYCSLNLVSLFYCSCPMS